ncbi:hypothetical protein DCO56_14650 [Sphingobacterium athyrii]|uniref:Uncharacterized protein n=1 Tax=Sphingobacterium athyrii TaxID=2152717 RepID=A0A363NV31_9SPHI|nr:hypothetical protein DCO56_14650 [Sphingobacterium athyrii]
MGNCYLNGFTPLSRIFQLITGGARADTAGVVLEKRLVHIKTENDYENEKNKHHPSHALDQRSLVEVFPQITFKEHIPRARIDCA